MRIFYISILVLLLAGTNASYALASSGDKQLDAAPAGLVPTNASLSNILAKHDAAAGTVAATKPTIADWSFTDTGMSGAEHLVRSGTDYHSTITTPAGISEYGQLDGKRWHKDTAGFTTPSTERDYYSFTPYRVAEDAADPKNDITLAGETANADPAYVVKVTVSGEDHPEWIYYDAASYHIVRTEYIEGDHRLITTFDDFRTTDGITQPWHLHDTYWLKDLDDDWHLTSFKAGATVTVADFTAPANTVSAGVAVRSALPARVLGGNLIIRLTVNGRGLDFDLNPTHRDNEISIDVAKQLSLPTYGQIVDLSNGDEEGFDTRLPDAQIGPVHLHDTPMRALDIAYEPDENTKIVGSLGYDFLAANIIHIDFVNGTVEAIPMADFAGKMPVKGQQDIPFQLDDGAPLIPMNLGDGFTDRVLLNPAFPFTIVASSYIDQHAGSFVDLTPGKKKAVSVPFADNKSYGRQAVIWFSSVSTLAFANLNFSNVYVLGIGLPGPHEAAAMLGYDNLRYYDLYFDYPHDRILMVPNKWFFLATSTKSNAK